LKKVLTIIPKQEERNDWQRAILKLPHISEIFDKSSQMGGIVGHRIVDSKYQLEVNILWASDLTQTIDIESRKGKPKEVQLKDILEMLYATLTKHLEISDFGTNRHIICAHFHIGLHELRVLFESFRSIPSSLAAELFNFFEGPIEGKGNFIITPYTILGDEDRATAIINQLKKENSEEKFTRALNSLFDFLWGRYKLSDLHQLATNLFIYWHSNGKCIGAKTVANSVETVKNSFSLLCDSLSLPYVDLFSLTEETLEASLTDCERMKRAFDVVDRLCFELSKA
jgi:hypothetical protein